MAAMTHTCLAPLWAYDMQKMHKNVTQVVSKGVPAVPAERMRLTENIAITQKQKDLFFFLSLVFCSV